MSIFDDGFDVEDATILGGIMGFAEESIREEEELNEELGDDIDVDMSEIKDTDLRLIHNMNPGLFKYIISIVKRQTAKWKQDRIDREEVEEELEALRESEELLGESYDD